jgi:hypothetical protein
MFLDMDKNAPPKDTSVTLVKTRQKSSYKCCKTKRHHPKVIRVKPTVNSRLLSNVRIRNSKLKITSPTAGPNGNTNAIFYALSTDGKHALFSAIANGMNISRTRIEEYPVKTIIHIRKIPN